MANQPKDIPSAANESGALYYFPEIPCHKAKDRTAGTDCGYFVGGSFDRKDDPFLDECDLRNSVQVRALMEEAFGQGMEQGRAEALTAEQDRIDRAVAALEAALAEMARVRRQDVRHMETETVRLALAIAKKIIGYESRCGQMVTHVVKSAMRKVADTRNLTLKLNPRDIDTIQANRKEWLTSDDAGAVVHLESDAAIQRGGCIIETQLGDVDAQVDSQIRIVEAMLEEQFAQSEPEK